MKSGLMLRVEGGETSRLAGKGAEKGKVRS
jgi:hypothetical protein